MILVTYSRVADESRHRFDEELSSAPPRPRTMSSLHSSSWSRSGGRTPRMSPTVISGSQAAMSYRGSHSPRSATASISVGVVRRSASSWSRIHRGVKPSVTSFHRCRWSGSSHVDLHRNWALIRADGAGASVQERLTGHPASRGSTSRRPTGRAGGRDRGVLSKAAGPRSGCGPRQHRR